LRKKSILPVPTHQYARQERHWLASAPPKYRPGGARPS
jgi:hypothetical protein